MTLVLLGVFGCVPAFDNNFSVSLRDAGIPAVPWITPLCGCRGERLEADRVPCRGEPAQHCADKALR